MLWRPCVLLCFAGEDAVPALVDGPIISTALSLLGVVLIDGGVWGWIWTIGGDSETGGDIDPALDILESN